MAFFKLPTFRALFRTSRITTSTFGRIGLQDVTARLEVAASPRVANSVMVKCGNYRSTSVGAPIPLPFSAQTSDIRCRPSRSTLSSARKWTSLTSARMSFDENRSAAGNGPVPFLKDAAQFIADVETFIFDCDAEMFSSEIVGPALVRIVPDDGFLNLYCFEAEVKDVPERVLRKFHQGYHSGSSRFSDWQRFQLNTWGADEVSFRLLPVAGVIWSAYGLFEGVSETIDLLRSLGKRVYFLTNNSTKSRKEYGKKCKALGLNVSEEEVFSSGFAAASYLKSIDFPGDKKVYLIGETGIQKEFEEAGIPYIGGSDHDDKELNWNAGQVIEHDNKVGAVVVAFDRHINYYKIQYATLCVRKNPGCLFIAANCDVVICPTGGQGYAGEASMVGALMGSTQKEPIVVGKPSTFMMDYLVNKFKIKKGQICMVGDNLETDILFGKNGGCKTLLVLTGVTDLDSLQSSENSIHPDFYTHQLSDLLAVREVPTDGVRV